MNKRDYNHVHDLWPAVQEMRQEGKSLKEIAAILGLTERAIANLIYREQHKKPSKLLSKSFITNNSNVSRKVLELENERLKMEVELLKAFQSEIGRK